VDVDAIRVRGEWVRHAPQHSERLGRAAEPTDGRWQRGDVVDALYLADEPDTAIAEWYRFLAEHGLPPGQAIPHEHHVWQLDLELADLSTRERLQAVKLQPPRPSRRTWPPFQAVGEELSRQGWVGLLAPSAARPNAMIACVFDHGAWPPAGCQPIRAVEIVDVPPPPTGMTT
jgi:RES domain-containing protein